MKGNPAVGIGEAIEKNILLRGNHEVRWSASGFDLGADPFATVRELRGDVFREAPGRVTLRFERDGKRYFLKWHSGVGWGEIFKNLLSFRQPVLSAENEWRAIERLESCGVPTMKAVAYGRRGRNPATLESFIVTEELAPAESLEDFTRDWGQSPPRLQLKRAVLREVARMTRDMHAVGMNHRDLYICHFLLHTDRLEQGVVKLSLIDLHRAQLRAAVPQRWRNKDLASLYFSSLHVELTRWEILRFLRLYFDEPLREVLQRERRQLRWLEREAERLRRKFLRKYAPGAKEG